MLRTACGILVPGQRIEPLALALEACSLNHWTREFPVLLSEDIALFFFSIFFIVLL